VAGSTLMSIQPRVPMRRTQEVNDRGTVGDSLHSRDRGERAIQKSSRCRGTDSVSFAE